MRHSSVVFGSSRLAGVPGAHSTIREVKRLTAALRPGSVDTRPRALVLLLTLLLVNVLGVSVLALFAMKTRIDAEEAERAYARQLALDALGVEVEFRLYQSLLDPMLMLRTLYRQGSAATGLQAVIDSHPYVRSLMVLDRDMALRRVWPDRGPESTATLLSQLAERLHAEGAETLPNSYSLRSFLGKAPGSLFVYQPIGATGAMGADQAAPSGRAEWALIDCDARDLIEKIVEPRLAEFASAKGLDVVLRGPDAAAEQASLRTPLNRILPGWSLELVPGPSRSVTGTALGQWSTLAASVGLLVAIALIGIAILAAIRREHALISMRNRFVANITHELKTPLALIRMYAETLCLGRMQAPEEMRECHEVILSESERLSRMISNVLDYSRLRQGLPVYRMGQHDLRLTIEETVDTYASSWANLGCTVDVDLDGTPPAVAHDAHGVRQILLNLVDNAIRHGGPEPRVQVQLRERGDRVELQVVDHGRGLAAPELQELWRTVQSGEMISEAQGSGLGLALVKRICDEHGADFDLLPTAGGRGLTARVSFAVWSNEGS